MLGIRHGYVLFILVISVSAEQKLVHVFEIFEIIFASTLRGFTPCVWRNARRGVRKCNTAQSASKARGMKQNYVVCPAT